MTWLIIVLVIIGLIIIDEIVIAFNLSKLNKRISKRNNTIYSLLTQQYDLIVMLTKMLEKANVNLPSDLVVSLNLHEQDKKLSTQESINIKTAINNAASGLLLIAETTTLNDDHNFLMIKATLNNFTKDYRKEVVLLNQDIYAYNYWVGCFIFKPIAFIFRLAKKEYIQ